MSFLLCDGSSHTTMPGTFLCTTSLLNLLVAHPAADDILRKGELSVSWSNVPGLRITVDMTIEQTINHHVQEGLLASADIFQHNIDGVSQGMHS